MDSIFASLVEKKIEKISERRSGRGSAGLATSDEHVVVAPSVGVAAAPSRKKELESSVDTPAKVAATTGGSGPSADAAVESTEFWKKQSSGGGAADPILRKALRQLDAKPVAVSATSSAAKDVVAGPSSSAAEKGAFFLPDSPSSVTDSHMVVRSKTQTSSGPSSSSRGTKAAPAPSVADGRKGGAAPLAVDGKKGGAPGSSKPETEDQRRRRLLKQRELRAKQVGVNAKLEVERDRRMRFERLTTEKNVDMAGLRKLAWTGAPDDLRGPIWRLLCGYLPTNLDRRQETLTRKRKEYLDMLPRYLEAPENERTRVERKTWQQITIDMPRTHTELPLFQQDAIQSRLRRLLYVWALRHPASGYVQGMNDLATPFLLVFVAEALDLSLRQTEQLGTDLPDLLEAGQVDMNDVEADTFWCFSKLLDGIQDHYTRDQPGIQRMIFKLHELIHRVDAPLYEHLSAQGLEFNMFAFRWMNCLLLREFPLPFIVRMWDTYLSDQDGFSKFHVYVCASFLVRLSPQLKQLEFQDCLLLLHNYSYSQNEFSIEELMSQAYVWQAMFQNAESHLR